MATQDQPIAQDRHVTARSVYGVLLVLAVLALLVFAARLAFPSGFGGVHREPAETAPAEPTGR